MDARALPSYSRVGANDQIFTVDLRNCPCIFPTFFDLALYFVEDYFAIIDQPSNYGSL